MKHRSELGVVRPVQQVVMYEKVQNIYWSSGHETKEEARIYGASV